MKKLLPLLPLLAAFACVFASARADEAAETVAPPAGTRPAFRTVEDFPGLPRVLLIGDSISIGYTVAAREALSAVANVHRPPVNCGPSGDGAANVDRWLGSGRWDVIHFNFGLHDLRRIDGKRTVTEATYEANLRSIVATLKQTGAKLIWATTTPVPATQKPGQFPRDPADVARFNEIAERVMKENDVAINDLNAAVAGRISELQPESDVHFNKRGYRVLAEQVASAVRAELPAKTAR